MKVNYGKKEIEFEIKFKQRKTLKISVKPNLEVEVLAPLKTNDEKIKETVLKRASWILEQKRYFEKFLPGVTERKYISGETHLYLGRQYRLKVIADKKKEVKLKGKYIYIYTSHKYDKEFNKRLLYDWYKSHAQVKFNDLFERCYEKLRKYDIEKPTWSIRKMKKRWGSYQPQNKHILLNVELIKSNVYCIEYVIIHELVHVKYPNHSKQFYRFMNLVMPDWKERKEKLESIII